MKYPSILLISLAAATTASAVTIVEWGDPNPYNTGIVAGVVPFSSSPPAAYTGVDVIGSAYYTTPAGKTPVFSAATSGDGATQIQNNASFDRIRMVNVADNTAHESMVAWEVSNWLVGPGGDSIETMTAGGFKSGVTGSISFVIQTTSGWFSTAAQNFGAPATFTVADASAESWFGFTPTMNTDASTNIGSAATPDLTDVISVGFYYHSPDSAAATSGFQIGYFQATIDGSGASGNTPPTFTVDPITKPAGAVGISYTGETILGSATDVDMGDTLVYSKVSGPSWLNVASDGVLSGTPTSAGTPATWTVQVSDGNGGTDTAQLEITIAGPSYPIFEAAILKKTAGVVGQAYVNAITGSAIDDSDIHLTFAKGAMTSSPAGGSDWLTMASNGALSGTPLVAGTYQWSISVTDSDTNVETATLEIKVDATAGPAKPKNVIVIVSDDAGYADFSFMDGLAGDALSGTPESIVPTPHLDELSNRGVTLARAYVAANCQPTRAAMVTGAYQQRIGNEVVGNNLNEKDVPGYEGVYEGVPYATDTVWDRFKALGYQTGAIGKWHLGSMPDDLGAGGYGYGNRPERQGIDLFLGMWHGSRFFDMGAITNPVGQAAAIIRKVEVTDHTPASLAFTDTVVESNGTPGYPNFVDDDENGYITTVFGKESAQFVADNHDNPNGFFIYVAHPAPHKPWEKNSPDYDDPRIAGMPETVAGGGNNFRKIVASMTITMDKEIGRLMDSLEDPDGDGEVDDSILNDTMVIFINDNGGVSGKQSDDVNGTDNGWLDGFKGSAKEGGIRVPAIIAGAGLDPAVANTIYRKAVHGVDIVPTSLAATGNPLTGSEPNIDGVNILPFINGTDTNLPHDLLVHRWRGNFTVIKGDYHLVNTGNNGQTNVYRYYKVATGDAYDDISQVNNLINDPTHAAGIAEGFRDLADHEVTFDKSRYPILNRTLASEPLNIIDHFVYRPGVATTFSANTWYETGTTNEHSLLTSDGCSQTVLEFPVNDSGNYTANSNLNRQTGQDFILNKIILSDDFTTGANATATIGGTEPLMLANSLSGSGAEIALDALEGANSVTFDVDVDLVLYHDLTISGDGDATFNINSGLTEFEAGFYAPRGIVKDGTSTANLTGANAYTGDTTVNAGVLSLAQVNTSNDSSTVTIAAAGATLDLTFGGTDTVNELYIGATQQPTGVYGAIGSGAPNEISQITGSGTLTITSGPAAGYTGWADANAPGQAADLDHDDDDVQNGIEYFMGESGSGFTAMPNPDSSGTIAWTMGATYAGNYGVDYLVETSSPDLQSWQPVGAADPNLTVTPGASVSYTLPTGMDSMFVRLLVNPD